MSDRDERQYVTVAMAAELTGIPARTLRRWSRDGQLPAVAASGGKLVALDDVERIVTMKRPDHGHHEPTATMAEPVATAMTTATRPLAEQQLATLRDGLVAPLVELTEKLTTAIAEQAETIGRVTAERDQAQRDRDALQVRLSTLEAAYVEVSQSQPDAPQTQPQRARWAFWKR